MKNSLKILLLSTVLAMKIVAAQDFSGNWVCQEMDSHDGYLSKETITLTTNSAHSDAKNGNMSYDLKINVPGLDGYTGVAVSNGNSIALYFEGIKDHNDKGVGLAAVSREVTGNNKYVEHLNKFFYEPVYAKTGSHGYGSCVKQS